MKFTSIVLAAASLLLVGATPMKRDKEVCPGQVIVSETFVGADNNVKLSQVFCPENVANRTLSARQSGGPILDVCGDTCNTFCFTPSGGGPDPNDCTVIAEAMLYLFVQNEALADFSVGTGSGVIFQLFFFALHSLIRSLSRCQTLFVNQDSITESYCYVDWAAIINYVAPNCQSTQNAHGGLCLAADEQWFIQLRLSTARSVIHG
ncbi:hypothetical protein BT96DRAFT_930095 [Gymnopus androsaceus JB14]|uniref:Uncharacterized protein n=1 Tax=Gymnopus androsaceus JB14 TaxID=1447944 RepID=A0A6A4GBT6_9AGAR|nr:hypothetical protein BT96DRAFT_930095 [Gymnopus androsaceus JB14]